MPTRFSVDAVHNECKRLSGGRYQRYRTLVDALEAVDVWLFEEEPHFFRSFPPDQWPEEVACASSSD